MRLIHRITRNNSNTHNSNIYTNKRSPKNRSASHKSCYHAVRGNKILACWLDFDCADRFWILSAYYRNTPI